jgi:FGGY-family pentulose kinase
MTDLVAAVDVGTGSARAGIFDATGAMLGRAEVPIETFRPSPGHAEQDSEAIWAAVGAALRAARAEAAAAPESVRGLAFDATCSLVVRDRAGLPLPVTPGAPAARDTMLWLDHRAATEAAECTATNDPALAEVGGVLSPEMQVPKLLWIKRRNAATWGRMGLACDLSDFLAWKATGAGARSLCTLACKWGYRAGHAEPWPSGFLERIGLGDLRDRAGLPDRPVPVGDPVGRLEPGAAAVLGLAPGIAVGAGLIDAHAGALAGLGPLAGQPDRLAGHLALIAGTSNCLMALAPEAVPRRGLWGPFRDAVLPGLSVLEGGQSVSGGLLDHICFLWGGTVRAGKRTQGSPEGSASCAPSRAGISRPICMCCPISPATARRSAIRLRAA